MSNYSFKGFRLGKSYVFAILSPVIMALALVLPYYQGQVDAPQHNKDTSEKECSTYSAKSTFEELEILFCSKDGKTDAFITKNKEKLVFSGHYDRMTESKMVLKSSDSSTTLHVYRSKGKIEGSISTPDKNILFSGDEYVELIFDFEDDVSRKQIKDIEDIIDKNLFDVSFKENSSMFSITKIMIARVGVNSLPSILELVGDSSLLESVSNNATIRIEKNGIKDSTRAYAEDTNFSFPNDPMYRDVQWNFDMIGVQQAWKTSTGKGVVVAVIDTGVSDGTGRLGRVPDLEQTEFVAGYNFVNDNNDTSDGSGHGTHVSGTIAQSTNNGIGVAGIAFDVKLMPVKVLSDEGYGTTSDIVEGIAFAVSSGANVINLSLGGGGYSKPLDDVLKKARAQNVFVACAAGNSGRGEVEYPAALEGCKAVSSVGMSGDLAFYSSYGEGLFIAAPGGDQNRDGQSGGVWQNTIANGGESHGYFPFQGTSMATPHVAGVAALIISKLGVEDYNVADVDEILKDGALKRDDPNKYGAGVLDAEKSISLVSSRDYHKYLVSLYGLFLIGLCLVEINLTDNM